MSRCFPFPPPGYESKPRTDHVELLTKEKHRKKKHKEKRDKEKGERKDKKERDRSKDKHREKKDRKEKHKDDKKDKNREKEQSRTSEDRTEQWAEGQHELKVGESRHTAPDFKGSKLTESFKRLRDEEKGTSNAMVENFSSSTRRRIEGISDAGLAEKGRVTDKQMAPSQRGTNGIERLKDHFADPIKRDEGLGMETKIEQERGTSNHVVPNLIVADRRKHATGQADVNFLGSTQQGVEGKSATIPLKERATKCDDKMTSNTITDQTRNHATVRQVNITDVSQRPEAMPVRTALEIERFKPKPVGTLQGNQSVGSSVEKILILRSGVPGSIEKERGKGNKVVPSLIGTEERSNGMGQSTGRGTNNSAERKENIRDKESDEYKGLKGDGQSNTKSRDTERSKDGHKGKEKKKKVRLKDEHKHKKEHNSTRDNGKADPIHNLNSIHLPPCKDNANGFVTDGNIKKRGGSETNGFLHENDVRPNKHWIISPSSHPPLKNGRISLDPFNTSMPSVRDGTKNNTAAEVIENKEHNINGITEPPIPSAKLRHPVPAGASVNKVSSRPPHPDSKYLDRIYAIPKMEDLPESDEWLFRSDDLGSKPKAKLEPEETPQVWSKALCIESEDVVALPYVVPF